MRREGERKETERNEKREERESINKIRHADLFVNVHIPPLFYLA